MNQESEEWHEKPDGAPDPWFRPGWEALADETPPPLPLPRPPPLPAAMHSLRAAAATLLGPLAAAQDALARLDAQAGMVSPDLRDGLIARLAFAEAAGLLAARGGQAHALDLALRAAERIGRLELHVRRQVGGHALAASARGADATWLDRDAIVDGVLPLARLLQHLPAADDPLATAETAQTRLGPLAPGPWVPFDPDRFAAWRAMHWPDGRRRGDATPALLRAALAAGTWMEAGIADVPDAAQALATTALWLRRAGALKTIPLPVWAGWSGLCAQGDPAALPRLRGDVAARLVLPEVPLWPAVFLHLAAEAARTGARILAALRQAEAAGSALAEGQDKRSRLPQAVGLLLRHPALTATALARHLAVTPQAALRLLTRLEAAGVVAEITGRKSFQAFAIVGF
jgi:hypothetical protein